MKCDQRPQIFSVLQWFAERIFLRKVGGGYIFVHRLLMEHFAELGAGVGCWRLVAGGWLLVVGVWDLEIGIWELIFGP